jgi:ankyrin repeat protein
MCASSCRRVSEENVTKIIKLLVENNANIEAYDKYCLTPLMLASRQNNAAVVKYLIDIGVDVDKQDENGWTVSLILLFVEKIENNKTCITGFFSLF